MKKEALEVLKNRRSVRKFKAEQIKEEELNLVLEAGTFAPTACGLQSPQIIAVQKPELVEKLVKLNAKVLGNDSNPYYGAPTIILIMYTSIAKSEELGILDAAAVTTNMLNAAYAVGLGSVWINRCKEMFELQEGKELLKEMGLPENLRGVASIALGYADCENPKPISRRDGYILKY